MNTSLTYMAPDYDYTKKSAQRGLGLQIVIAFSLGLSSILVFSVWRRRWPRLYAARTFRRPDLPQLPPTLFGWINTVLHISDSQVLEYAGLDAYVYLTFFKASLDLFWRLTAISVCAIGPLRWWYTGQYEEGDDDPRNSKGSETETGDGDERYVLFGNFLWVYLISCTVFTYLTLRIFTRYTYRVVKVRQLYLGQQKTITDRTLCITGIPRSMCTKQALIEYISRLNVGEPDSVVLCMDWSNLDALMAKREKIILKLEHYWADFLGPTFINELDAPTHRLILRETPEEIAQQAVEHRRRRPRGKLGFWGLKGPTVDFIDHYTRELAELDKAITRERQRTDIPVTNSAFMTMDSVGSCQLVAQSVLEPKPHRLVAKLAPSPRDVVWEHVYLPSFEKAVRSYIITFIFVLTSAFMLYPVKVLASLLDMDKIEKFLPGLAQLIRKSEWLETFVTQVLPTLVFTLFNLVVPYFYAWLSDYQGFISSEDAELASVAKNFFYVFVNLFLVFMIATNYLSLLDTTQIAVKLADVLKQLSSFYTNLIILQGIGVFPARLLQAGSLLQFPFFAAHCKSARDYLNLYKPSTLNYGVILPTPLLMFMIMLMYSVISIKILFFGSLYFAVGYCVYKYQFIYSMVHPQHSTGRLWASIYRRVLLGLLLFHLSTMGVLVLQKAYKMAASIVLLMVVVGVVWYDFEKSTEPLLRFIALAAAVHEGEDGEEPYRDDPEVSLDESPGNVIEQVSELESTLMDDISESSRSSGRLVSELRRSRSQTLDENRDFNRQYVNPNVTCPLDGPWIGVEGTDYVVANATGMERRPLDFDDWE